MASDQQHVWAVAILYALTDEMAAASIATEPDTWTLTTEHMRALHGPYCAVCEQEYRDCYHSPCPGEQAPPPEISIVLVPSDLLGDLELCPECGTPGGHTFGCRRQS